MNYPKVGKKHFLRNLKFSYLDGAVVARIDQNRGRYYGAEKIANRTWNEEITN